MILFKKENCLKYRKLHITTNRTEEEWTYKMITDQNEHIALLRQMA